MADLNVDLPLAEIPEELETAEVEVLLEYLRENAAGYELSDLRELALAAGYRASVVERAVEDFEGEPRPAPEPEPEPPPVPVEAKPRAAIPAVPPAPPPPMVPVFLEKLAEAEQTAQRTLARANRPVSPGLALLIVLLNAVVLSLLFTDAADLGLLFYVGELALGFLLAGLQNIHSARRAAAQGERLASSVPAAAPVRSEPGRTAVPPLPHEVRAETPQIPSVPTRTPSRR
jgi:hypothetical protein